MISYTVLLSNIILQLNIQWNLPTTGLLKAARLSATAKLSRTELSPYTYSYILNSEKQHLSTPTNGQNSGLQL